MRPLALLVALGIAAHAQTPAREVPPTPRIELHALPEVPPPPDTPPSAATGAEMTTLKNSLRKAPRPADSLRVLRAAAAELHFTAGQAMSLAKTLDRGADRVEALVLLYPRVVDRKNFHPAYYLLPNAADRKVLEAALAEPER